MVLTPQPVDGPGLELFERYFLRRWPFIQVQAVRIQARARVRRHFARGRRRRVRSSSEGSARAVVSTAPEHGGLVAFMYGALEVVGRRRERDMAS